MPDWRKKSCLLTIVPLIFQLLLIGGMAALVGRVETRTTEFLKSRDVVWYLEELRTAHDNAMFAMQVYTMNKNPIMRDQFVHIKAHMPFVALRLQNAIGDKNPAELEDVKQICQNVNQAELCLLKIQDRCDTYGYKLGEVDPVVQALWKEWKAHDVLVFRGMDKIGGEENAIFADCLREKSWLYTMFKVFFVVATLASLALAVGLGVISDAIDRRRAADSQT
jgi:hypothetical protein